MRLTRRIGIVATALVLLGGLTGVALAANDAVPGDPLYGIDQALESIGIGNGAAGERLAEASVLASNGKVAEALDHAAQALDQAKAAVASAGDGADGPEPTVEVETVGDAADALRAAADQVASDTAADESQAIRDAVAEMLDWMATQIGSDNFDGQTFGQAVSQMAQDIAGAPDPVVLPDQASPDVTIPDLPDQAEGRIPDSLPAGP